MQTVRRGSEKFKMWEKKRREVGGKVGMQNEGGDKWAGTLRMGKTKRCTVSHKEL